MGVSIVILTDETADQTKIKNYWTPVQLKYNGRPEFDFIFAPTAEAGVSKAKNNQVFITPWNMVPTYETLITIEALKPNQRLMPKVHGTNESSGAYSIVKQGNNTEVIDNTTMYKV